MKALLVILFSTVFFSKSYAQLSLPQVSTTKEKAFLDLDNNIANEDWFKVKNEDGSVSYSKLFKATPVGINHAMTEYNELVKEFKTKDCIDKSLFSSGDKDSFGTINYNFLAMNIKRESSEIKKTCFFNDNEIESIRLVSSFSQPNSFLTIILLAKKK
jgi:hypothetical protein